MQRKATQKEANQIAKKFGINHKIIPKREWLYALNVELEHGSILGSLTNITNDNLDLTARIAIAHLLEDPNYYHFLRQMEEKREKFWKNKVKSSPFL